MICNGHDNKKHGLSEEDIKRQKKEPEMYRFRLFCSTAFSRIRCELARSRRSTASKYASSSLCLSNRAPEVYISVETILECALTFPGFFSRTDILCPGFPYNPLASQLFFDFPGRNSICYKSLFCFALAFPGFFGWIDILRPGFPF